MAIYTKKGDRGETSLLSGEKVSKNSFQMHAIGNVDELNTNIGMAKALLLEEQRQETADIRKLSQIQEDLFCIGSFLAGKEDIIGDLEAHILTFEEIIDRLTTELPELKNFILPSGSKTSIQFQICRTICRRAERYTAEATDNETIKKYLNRLSDLMFMFARICNYMVGETEHVWNKKEEENKPS